MWNCKHRKDFISDEEAAKQRQRWGNVNTYLIKPISDRNPRTLNKDQQKQFKDFSRGDYDGENAKVQNDSIKSFLTNKDILSKEYVERFGNVVNTDDARKLYIDVGYSGTNAGAVHEASSALSKEALKRLIKESDSNTIEMYAWGAGSGKTSSIEGLRPGMKEKAAAVIDGTMSSFEGAEQKISQFLKQGKEINVSYAYRDPEDAWRNGVIKRMLSNKEEMGRTVSMSTFLETTEGSYNTVKTMFDVGFDKHPGVNINIIDNSLGYGKTAYMEREKFDSITFGEELRQKLLKTTKKLLEDGTITKSQYDALIL
jgi:hypothetical protein